MDFDQLKNQWRKEMNTVQHSNSVIFAELQTKVTRLNNFSLYEDVRDISLWLIVAFIFSLHWLLASNVTWPERIGLITILSTCCFIIYRTLKVRAEGRSDGWTLSEKVVNEINRIEKKSRLLMQSTTWYLLPLYVGIFLVPIDRLHDKTSSYTFSQTHLYYCLFSLIMGVAGYWLSRKTVEKKYSPVLSNLKSLRSELEKNSDNP